MNLSSTGAANYRGNPKLTTDSLDGAGVTITDGVQLSAKMMLGSSLVYFLLQGPGLKYAAFTGVW